MLLGHATAPAPRSCCSAANNDPDTPNNTDSAKDRDFTGMNRPTCCRNGSRGGASGRKRRNGWAWGRGRVGSNRGRRCADCKEGEGEGNRDGGYHDWRRVGVGERRDGQIGEGVVAMSGGGRRVVDETLAPWFRRGTMPAVADAIMVSFLALKNLITLNANFDRNLCQIFSSVRIIIKNDKINKIIFNGEKEKNKC